MTLTDTAAPEGVRIHELNDYIASGKILEAMHEFYAPGIEMRENNGEPTTGLDANIEREKEFLASVKEFHEYTPLAIATGPDLAIVESRMRFTDNDDNEVTKEQVSVQRWQGGKIVSERFFYDPTP